MLLRIRLRDSWACLRGYLHQDVTNVKDTEQRVELLPFQMQVCLETFQTSGAGEGHQATVGKRTLRDARSIIPVDLRMVEIRNTNR